MSDETGPNEYPLHEDCSPETRPYVLWFETLPSGDTAKVFVWPRQYDAAVALHWNGQINPAFTISCTGRPVPDPRAGRAAGLGVAMGHAPIFRLARVRLV